jgi:hypothetical protein
VKIGASNGKECIAGEGESRVGRFLWGEFEGKKRAGRTALEIARGNCGVDYAAHSPLVTQGEREEWPRHLRACNENGRNAVEIVLAREGNCVVCLAKSDVHLPFGLLPLLKTERFCMVRRRSSASGSGRTGKGPMYRRARCIVPLQGHGTGDLKKIC